MQHSKKKLILGVATIFFSSTLCITSICAQDGGLETAKTKSSLRVTFAAEKRKPNRAADVVNANRAAEKKADRKGKGKAVIPLGSSVKPKSKARPSTSAGVSTSKTRLTSSGSRQLTTASSVQRSGRVPKPRSSSIYRDRSTSRKSIATTSRARGNAGTRQQTSRRPSTARPSAAQLARNNGAKNPRALKDWKVWDTQTKPAALSSKRKKAGARKVTVKSKKRRRK